MKGELSFYEQAALVVPGGVLLFGALLLNPELQPLFTKDGITIGGLGLFLLLAYALGQLVAAVGNVLEALVWTLAGGMPSTWVRSRRGRLLPASQIEALQEKMKARLGVDLDIRGMSHSSWKHQFALLYRDVLMTGAVGRIETFNGNYGLNRGLAASTLVLVVICAARRPEHWLWWSAALGGISVVHVFRMCRFGIHFSREVFHRFLLLPDAR